MGRWWLAAVVAAGFQATAAPPAVADDSGVRRAAELDALGKAAYGKRQCADAAAAFEAAWEADGEPKHPYDLGRCYENLGDLARASRRLERCVKAAPGAGDRGKVDALGDARTTDFADLDGDGLLDLVATGNADDHATLWFGVGDGTIWVYLNAASPA